MSREEAECDDLDPMEPLGTSPAAGGEKEGKPYTATAATGVESSSSD
jgi:hypothetical protein